MKKQQPRPHKVNAAVHDIKAHLGLLDQGESVYDQFDKLRALAEAAAFLAKGLHAEKGRAAAPSLGQADQAREKPPEHVVVIKKTKHGQYIVTLATNGKVDEPIFVEAIDDKMVAVLKALFTEADRSRAMAVEEPGKEGMQ